MRRRQKKLLNKATRTPQPHRFSIRKMSPKARPELRSLLAKLVEQNNGDIPKAAAQLGMHRESFYRMAKSVGARVKSRRGPGQPKRRR